MRVSSPTGAAEALYEANRAHLTDYLSGFSVQDHQAGALFAINGRAIGFDLFDSATTMQKQLPKLVQSYALDAIDEGEQVLPENESHEHIAASLLQAAAKAEVEQFPAVGEGDDLRLRGVSITGGGLLHPSGLVHLCVFRMLEGNQHTDNPRNTRMARASSRRGHWNH